MSAKLAGEPSHSRVELFTQNAYFYFQLIQVFLITTITSSASAAVTAIIDNPGSIFQTLASSLPKSSNFYISIRHHIWAARGRRPLAEDWARAWYGPRNIRGLGAERTKTLRGPQSEIEGKLKSSYPIDDCSQTAPRTLGAHLSLPGRDLSVPFTLYGFQPAYGKFTLALPGLLQYQAIDKGTRRRLARQQGPRDGRPHAAGVGGQELRPRQRACSEIAMGDMELRFRQQSLKEEFRMNEVKLASRARGRHRLPHGILVIMC